MNPAALSRFAPLAVASLVAVTAGAALAPITWHSLGASTSGQAPMRHENRQTGSQARDRPDVSAITAMAPFGLYIPPDAALPETARETELGLVLRGVLVAAHQRDSSAFIARGNEVKAYGIGDEVVRGAILSAVYRDHIQLQVGGVTETLSFPDTAVQARNRAGVDSIRARLSPSARAAAAPAASGGSEAAPSAEEVIEDYRQRIARNPRTVLDGLGLEPTGEGYRIGENAPAVVRRAGLRPGDVVVRVNGEVVGDVEADRRLYDRVAASGQARIEIMRDGRTISLSFPLQ